MNRHIVLAFAASALAGPALAQSTSDTARASRVRIERERAEREREREREQEVQEHEQEARDRARDLEQARRDREQERRDRDQERRDREREQERQRREAASSLDTTVTFDGHGTVSVNCPGGAVIVVGADRNEVRVRARTENGAIRFTSNGSRAILEPASGRRCSDGRFEVTVPSTARVVASSWSGSVSVRGVHGDIETHTQSADVEVRDAGARLDIESLSGDVTVQGVKGDATINTMSGDVELSGSRGGLEIETVSGDLSLRDVIAKQIRAHTTSGDVEFAGQIVDAGRYEFNTHSGEIRLQLPANVGAQLSVSTFSGGIESDFPITLKTGEPGGSMRSKRLDFTLGQGSARIIAETFSGDITLSSNGRRR
jgi:DUF4097 and DUF4098 domain-containing protein YvlB